MGGGGAKGWMDLRDRGGGIDLGGPDLDLVVAAEERWRADLGRRRGKCGEACCLASKGDKGRRGGGETKRIIGTHLHLQLVGCGLKATGDEEGLEDGCGSDHGREGAQAAFCQKLKQHEGDEPKN